MMYVYICIVFITVHRWFQHGINCRQIWALLTRQHVDNKKVHMKKIKRRNEFHIWKLIRIKIRVLPTSTHSLVGKASARQADDLYHHVSNLAMMSHSLLPKLTMTHRTWSTFYFVLSARTLFMLVKHQTVLDFDLKITNTALNTIFLATP